MEDSGLRKYMHEIRNYPLLSKNDEQRIFGEIEQCQFGIGLQLIKIPYFFNNHVQPLIPEEWNNDDEPKVDLAIQTLSELERRIYSPGTKQKHKKRFLDLYVELAQRTYPYIEEFEGEYLPAIKSNGYRPKVLEKILNGDRQNPGVYRLQAKRESLKSEVFVSNLKLVVSIAKKYQPSSFNLLERIQEGSMGLIRAIEKFEYQRDIKFSTYAGIWIRQAISRAITDTGRTIRIPVNAHEKMKIIYREMLYYQTKYNVRMGVHSLAGITGFPKNLVNHLMEVLDYGNVSLEEAARTDSKLVIGDTLIDPLANPESDAIKKDLCFKARKALSSLYPKEERILRMRHGIDEKKAHTLKEIGQDLSVTPERVRQIEKAAIRKLRHTSVCKDLIPFIGDF